MIGGGERRAHILARLFDSPSGEHATVCHVTLSCEGWGRHCIMAAKSHVAVQPDF